MHKRLTTSAKRVTCYSFSPSAARRWLHSFFFASPRWEETKKV